MTIPSTDSQGSGTRPKTIASLVRLYYDRYKPLYNGMQTFNQMPVELVFEIAAAWDHLSRHWQYSEPEDSCVDRAASHVKRAVFDAYKLILKQTVDQYNDLMRIDTSLIDNGQFDSRLRALMSEIRADSIAARSGEGNTGGSDGWDHAFALWGAVHAKMEQFRTDFYLNKNVDWARQKTAEFAWKRRLESIYIAVGGAIVGGLVVEVLHYCYSH